MMDGFLLRTSRIDFFVPVRTSNENGFRKSNSQYLLAMIKSQASIPDGVYLGTFPSN